MKKEDNLDQQMAVAEIVAQSSGASYLFFGNVGEISTALVTAIGKRSSTNFADVLHRSFEQCGVEDARALVAFGLFKPIGTHKHIVLSARFITPEAQHALLKAVEEGVGKTIFYIVVPHGTTLLPTLVSRCVVVKQSTKDDSDVEQARAFLKSSYAERLALAETFGKESDRDGARALVASLLRLHTQQPFSKALLRDVLDAERFLALSGSSPKHIVSHLALTL